MAEITVVINHLLSGVILQVTTSTTGILPQIVNGDY